MPYVSNLKSIVSKLDCQKLYVGPLMIFDSCRTLRECLLCRTALQNFKNFSKEWPALSAQFICLSIHFRPFQQSRSFVFCEHQEVLFKYVIGLPHSKNSQ